MVIEEANNCVAYKQSEANEPTLLPFSNHVMDKCSIVRNFAPSSLELFVKVQILVFCATLSSNDADRDFCCTTRGRVLFAFLLRQN